MGVIRRDTLGRSGGPARVGVPSGSRGFRQTSRGTTKRIAQEKGVPFKSERVIKNKDGSTTKILVEGKEVTVIKNGKTTVYQTDEPVAAQNVSIPQEGVEPQFVSSQGKAIGSRIIREEGEPAKKVTTFESGLVRVEQEGRPTQFFKSDRPLRPSEVAIPTLGIAAQELPTMSEPREPLEGVTTFEREGEVFFQDKDLPDVSKSQVDIEKLEGYRAKAGGFAYNLLTSVNAPIISKHDPFKVRLQKTLYTVTAIGAKQTGTLIRNVQERPLQTAATLTAFALASPIGGRVLSLGTGLALKTAKSVVNLGILGGFLGYQEVKQPGSVTTVPGLLYTLPEFTQYALIAKAGGATVKAGVSLSPRFIPSYTTTAQVKPSRVSRSQIPIFEGSTRVEGRGALLREVGKEVTMFHTTGATPTEMFGKNIPTFGAVGGGPIARTFMARFGKAKFTVKEPAKGEVGGERARFGEDFFFTSPREAYTMFGEQAAGRLGGIGRAKGLERATAFIKTRPKAADELFLRSDMPLIYRIQGKVESFSPKTMARINRGETGANLRRTLVSEVKGRPGIFPGTRTTALGRGELEFNIRVGTDLFKLRGPERFTYLPYSSRFARVVDIGLEPGKAAPVSYNLRGRLGNIGQIVLSDVFGLVKFRGISIKEGGKARSARAITEITTRGRAGVTTRRFNYRDIGRRIPARDISGFRERGRERDRVRDPIRERPRERRGPDRIRIPERRVPERIRDPVRPRRGRERTRGVRDILREPGRTTRPRTRLREPIPRVPPPPVYFQRGLGETKVSKKLRKVVPGTLFRPSLRALAFDIKGPKPETLTGFELRPIPLK